MPKHKRKKSYANGLGEASACGCGGANLILGPMTLHFAADEIEALYDLVAAATEMLGEPDAGHEPRGVKRGKQGAHGQLH